MADQGLIDYIKGMEAQGYTDEQIKQGLIGQGWGSDNVDSALMAAHGITPAKEELQEADKPEIKRTGRIKRRNPVLVLVFSIFTLGIYAIYWIVSTTKELRRTTEHAPNPWLVILLFIPLLNIIFAFYYFYKYSKAINELTEFSTAALYLLFIFLGPIAMIIAQIQLNKES